MGSLAQAKSLGGVGSILLILTMIPSAGPILGIVGFVPVLIAVKYISEALADNALYKNALISVVMGIIGLAAGLAVGTAGFLSFFGMRGFFRGPFESDFQPRDFMGPQFFNFMLVAIVGLAIVWVFTIVSAIFLRKSFNKVASRLNIGHFRTAATLYLVGAALVIVGIGFIIIFVAAIIQTVAFFSIPGQTPGPSQPPPASPPP